MASADPAAALVAALDALERAGVAGVGELRARREVVHVGVRAEDDALAAILFDARHGAAGGAPRLRTRAREAERAGRLARARHGEALAGVPAAEARVVEAREAWRAAEDTLAEAEARLAGGCEALTTARQHHAAAALAVARAGSLPWFLVRREGRLATVLAMLLGWLYAGVARRVASALTDRRTAAAAVTAARAPLAAARAAVVAAEAAAVTATAALAAARHDRDALLTAVAVAGHDAARAAQAEAIARADLSGWSAALAACAQVGLAAVPPPGLLPPGLLVGGAPADDTDGWLVIGDALARSGDGEVALHLPTPLAEAFLGERLTGVAGPATARVAALLAPLPATLAPARDRRLAVRLAALARAHHERSPDPALLAAAERLAEPYPS